jgi:transposase
MANQLSMAQRETIQALTAQRIFQDLSSEHGFSGAYNSVKRMVARLSGGEALPFRRLECEPGAEAQADFGTGAPIVGPDGQRRRTHVQRLSLSYSRKAYSEVFLRQTTESLLTCWENAFWTWGGVPRTLIIDNLKAAVTRADWYDPELHPRIVAFCQYYGTVLLPTKPYTPRHKGKIESQINYVQSNGLKGRSFETLAAENVHLAQWESRVADLRIHGTTKKQVRLLFEQVERPALLSLPQERFPFFHEDRRVVHRDGHVEVDKAYYSVPPEYMGRRVWVRWDSRMVRIFNAQFVEIGLHARQEFGRFRTAPQHLASRKIALVEQGATELLRRARLVGPQTARWAEAVLKTRGIEGVRPLSGLLALTRRHSSTALERACAQAAGRGAFRLRELKALLKEPLAQEEMEFMAEHPVIRNLHDYGVLVQPAFNGPWREPPLVLPAPVETTEA